MNFINQSLVTRGGGGGLEGSTCWARFLSGVGGGEGGRGRARSDGGIRRVIFPSVSSNFIPPPTPNARGAKKLELRGTFRLV